MSTPAENAKEAKAAAAEAVAAAATQNQLKIDKAQEIINNAKKELEVKTLNEIGQAMDHKKVKKHKYHRIHNQ